MNAVLTQPAPGGGPHLQGEPPDRTPNWVRLGLFFVLSVYVLYSSFGIAGPYLWGHFGYHGATYVLRARMTLRFHLLTPATWPGFVVPPLPQSFYFHHPIGYHHLLVPFLWLFGDHEWVARAVAAGGGLLCLGALYALTKRHFGAPAGLLATAVYVGLPIVGSFSTLSDPMLLAMACCLVTADAYVQYLREPTRRWLWQGCAGLVLGGLLMWESYFQAFFLGAHALVLIFVGRRLRPVVTRRTPIVWFVATFFASSLTMAFHFLLMWKKGAFADFLTSYQSRHSASFEYAKAQHIKWLLLLYGKPLLWLGGAWLVGFVLRLLRGKTRRRDVLVLLFFLINTLYIALFPSASAIHLYRVFFYSSFLALAVADLALDLHSFLRWITTYVAESQQALAQRIPVVVTVLLLLAYFATVGPHTYRNVLESRVLMGTHGQPGYDPQYEKLRFAQEASRRSTKEVCFAAFNLPHRIEFEYYLDRSFCMPQTWGNLATLAQVPQLQREHPNMILVLDSQLVGEERRLLIELLRQHPGYLYGTYLLVDLGQHGAGLTEYRFAKQRPSWTWRWLVSHQYPPLLPVPHQSPHGQRLRADLSGS